MRKILTRLTLILVFCIGVSAFSKLQSQIVVAKWHFDNPTKQGAITDNASFASSPYTADDGIVENKDIATISLGGSVNYNGWVTGASGTPDKAPNSNAWNLTDGYWQIGIVTTGYKDLTLSSKQQSSNTGPTDFQIQYSTDNGSSWLDVGTAITVANNFTSGVVTDLALPAECNNLANLLIRWRNTSDVSVNNATVIQGGTNRIDDIVVMGTLDDPCLATVPFVEGFESGFTNNTAVAGCWTQAKVDGKTEDWKANSTETDYNRAPRNGAFNATLKFNGAAWLFHKVYLTQGIVYDFSVWARQDETSGALLTLAWGAENNAAAMTNIIVDAQVITNGDYQEVKGTFTVPTDGVYYIGIKGTTTYSPWYLSIDDISLDFGPTCVAPENIQASNITSDATTITWDASITSVAAYNVYSSDVNTAPADDIANSEYTEVSGVTTTLGGLTPNTTYYVWVRSDCGSGDYSTWAGPISFTTTQIPATLPYADDFETNNFTFVNGTQTNKWAYGSATGNPANAIYISNDDGTTNAYTNYSAISTVQAYRDIVIPTGTTIVNFSFDWKCYGESSYDYLRVWLVPTSYIPTAGTQITAGTGRIQIGGNFNQQDTWQTYQNLVLDLSSFAGQTMRLVFEWQNDGSGGTQPPAAIDNVNISIPSCIAPTNLQASLTGLKSANLTWTAPTSVPANGYQIFSNTTGVAPSESSTPVITVAATETSFATGDVLDLANTTYYAWIRSDCGGDFSSWAGPATVTTPMYVPSPWVEEFATSTTPTGWTTSNIFLSSSNSAINSGDGSTTYYMYKNLYSSATTGNFSTVLVGPISGTEDFSFDYKLANYSSPYAPPVSGSGNFVVEISTDFGNTWSEIETVSNNGVAGWQNKSYPISTYAIAGDYVKFRITANWLTGGGDYCIGFDNFNLASCFPISGLSVANIEENSATISWNASTSSPANYNVYYSEVNAAPANDIADTEYSEVTGLTTELSELTPVTTYYVWVRSACGADENSVWTGISFETTPSCFEPTNIQASDITINSANISWTAATESPDATYHVYYSLVDAAPADDIDIAECEAPATNSIELTDLTSSSTYYVWVRSVCGADDFSTWAGPSVFSTSCAIISEYPYFEGFNSGIDPACWTIIDNDNSGDSWYSGTYASTPSYEGASMMVSEFSYPNDDWLISPQFKITSDNLKVDFYAKSYSAYFYESFNVLISKTGTSPSDFTIVLENIVDHPNTWQNHEYILSEHGINIDDEIYVAIQHVSNDQFVLFIDAFTVSEIEIPSAEAEILTYSIPNQVGDTEITSTETEGTITVTMPFGTEVTNLVADFTLSDGATAQVDTEDQASGVTPNNFTNPVTYTVTAEDGTTTKDWTVTVNVSTTASSEAEILTYSLPNQVGEAEINSGATEGTITVTMPYDTEVANLVANFTLSYGATAKVDTEDQASGVTPNNFTDPVVYAVTAQDGSTIKNWTVTVNLEDAPSSEANILTYSFAEQYSPAVIDDVNHTVTVVVNEGTSLDALVATFTLSPGASAKIGAVDQESGVTENNFTDPVIYTVTAEDGTTTQPWTVTVSVYVGIEDVENSALAIYPNPNNGNFTLDFTNINGKVNYQIYDTKGSIIISDDFVANGSAIKEVSLNLVPGVYFVRLVTETQSLVEKLVVE